MDIQLKMIEAEHCIPLRHLVLRNNKSIKTCIFTGDELKSTFHVGAFFNDSLVAIVSFMPFKNSLFSSKKQYQLRGMAVHPNFQGKGLGKKLLQFSLTHLRQIHIEICWCNARIKAVDFYQKEGFEKHGETFEIPEVGPHQLMAIKTLDSNLN